MDTYDVELESADPDGFAVTVPAFPGLLVLGATIDDVLARARASIAFHLRARDDGYSGAVIRVAHPLSARPPAPVLRHQGTA